ncbi:DUF4262 domain-containing protein [Mycolicibacterium sp. GCM10028919]|uniref:DUF4262 domain-containing protein n=1 Tax=Mycolicibacterium sp. GCM10028919 TaxID=3273401 RepID=UPI00360FED76
MCWSCDHPDKTREDYFDVLRDIIRRHGWAVQAVEDHRAPFSYTIGLHRHGLPEMLVTGLSPERAAQLLNDAADGVLVHGMPPPGTRLTLLGLQPVEVVEVDHPEAHMHLAYDIARGRLIVARQLVWADALGRWPWARGFDRGMRRQPVFGVRGAR